ncbi:hypothetical protein CCACVL1_25253 [Corchorus capsularis]|uniref:SHSP domain-containing protein n=1 Tax=Corchorus capsularis TaxID=210143 RepID=A0A1R3GLE2_COCAP|nr:hypothetical protein CCACVL1_25253 [Corchorus capsularis]
MEENTNFFLQGLRVVRTEDIFIHLPSTSSLSTLQPVSSSDEGIVASYAGNFPSNIFTGLSDDFPETITNGGYTDAFPKPHFVVPVYKATVRGSHRNGFVVKYHLESLLSTGQPSPVVVQPVSSSGEDIVASYASNFPFDIFIGRQSTDYLTVHCILLVYAAQYEGGLAEGYVLTYILNRVVPSTDVVVRTVDPLFQPPPSSSSSSKKEDEIVLKVVGGYVVQEPHEDGMNGFVNNFQGRNVNEEEDWVPLVAVLPNGVVPSADVVVRTVDPLFQLPPSSSSSSSSKKKEEIVLKVVGLSDDFPETITNGGYLNAFPKPYFVVLVYKATVRGNHRNGFMVKYHLESLLPTEQPSSVVVQPVSSSGEDIVASYAGNFPSVIFIGHQSTDYPAVHCILPVYAAQYEGSLAEDYVLTYILNRVVPSADAVVRTVYSLFQPPLSSSSSSKKKEEIVLKVVGGYVVQEPQEDGMNGFVNNFQGLNVNEEEDWVPPVLVLPIGLYENFTGLVSSFVQGGENIYIIIKRSYKPVAPLNQTDHVPPNDQPVYFKNPLLVCISALSLSQANQSSDQHVSRPNAVTPQNTRVGSCKRCFPDLVSVSQPTSNQATTLTRRSNNQPVCNLPAINSQDAKANRERKHQLSSLAEFNPPPSTMPSQSPAQDYHANRQKRFLSMNAKRATARRMLDFSTAGGPTISLGAYAKLLDINSYSPSPPASHAMSSRQHLGSMAYVSTSHLFEDTNPSNGFSHINGQSQLPVRIDEYVDESYIDGRWRRVQPPSPPKRPPVDVKDTPTAVVFKVDVPGFKKEELAAIVQGGNIIRLIGQKNDDVSAAAAAAGVATNKMHRREREDLGKFSRSFRLLRYTVNPNGGRAKLEDGVLTVILPKEVGKGDVTVIPVSD